MFGEDFGAWVDRTLLSDVAAVFLGVVAFPLAHLAALVVALKFKRPAGVFAVNVAFSFLVVFYLISQPEYFRDISEGGKDPFWMPAGFEAAVLGCGAAALLRARWARGPSYVFFALHATAFVALALLAILFGSGSHR